MFEHREIALTRNLLAIYFFSFDMASLLLLILQRTHPYTMHTHIKCIYVVKKKCTMQFGSKKNKRDKTKKENGMKRIRE